MEQMIKTVPLICPLCGTPLCRQDSSLVCGGPRRHCYDIAASGYVNLLPPGKKNNAKSGDEPDMLRARRQFLSGGWYDAISHTAGILGAEALDANTTTPVFLDAGSGDGYHTCKIAETLQASGRPGIGLGLEASKHGAAAGAKLARQKGLDTLRFAAGNIFQMPVEDHNINLLYSMFAPIPVEEAKRVLTRNGALIVVSSGRRHLWELRSVLYGTPRENNGVTLPADFEKIAEKTLSYTIDLPDSETIANLFTMTPFYYRCPKEGREHLLSLTSLTVSVEVEISVLQQRKTH